MPFSFTLLSPGTLLFLIASFAVVSLLRNVFGHRKTH